jgi:hypothetical protein
MNNTSVLKHMHFSNLLLSAYLLTEGFILSALQLAILLVSHSHFVLFLYDVLIHTETCRVV